MPREQRFGYCSDSKDSVTHLADDVQHPGSQAVCASAPPLPPLAPCPPTRSLRIRSEFNSGSPVVRCGSTSTRTSSAVRRCDVRDLARRCTEEVRDPDDTCFRRLNRPDYVIGTNFGASPFREQLLSN